ncbi:hypothetical protein E2N92_12810 [Methanofollis formosanus]|uniref:Uncharacterized protein n=1 Tax=Methanofollis formosanus TaxID=299308 RepID=A0A8G1EGW1_9EURY|nr:hypothetical protein [Methanofollis formosanus]QYZ80248.1 hypothetical protein E2N92_12810 [Methanofollis formosanus]
MKKIRFPTIDPTVRRLLIFLSTVTIGSVFILYDVPTELLVVGTVAAGCLTLFIFGAAHLSDLKPSQIKKAIREFRAGKKKAEGPVQVGTEKKQGKGIVASLRSACAQLPGAFGDSAGRLKTTLFHKDEKIKEIDSALEAAMAAPGGAPEAVREAGGPGGGLDLGDDEFGDEDLEGLDLGEGGLAVSGHGLDIPLDAEVPGAAVDASAVSAILEAHAEELEEFAELGEIEDLDNDLSEDLEGLDEVDLDSLDLSDADIDGIQPEPEDEEEDSSLTEALQADLAPQPDAGGGAAPAAGEEGGSGGPDMLAFATGSGDPNDLMSLLKDDVKKKRAEDHDSLLRDLKGKKFEAENLAGELEETLGMLRTKTVKKSKVHSNE